MNPNTPNANATILNFRLDPLENEHNNPTPFELYDVKLTANPRPTSGSYTINYTTVDGNGDNATVTFFHDNDKSGFNGTQFGQDTGVAPGAHTHVWDMSALAAGDYWIYTVITDSTGNEFKQYANVPVTIDPSASAPVATTSTATYDGVFKTATFTGTVNPSGLSTSYYFEYGTDTTYGSQTATVLAGSCTTPINASGTSAALNGSTTYHYRLVATNASGTVRGADMTVETTSITITFETATTVREGDEYFSDILNDPRDFATRRDIMWEQNFTESTIAVSGGIWSGDSVAGSYLYPLYQGNDTFMNRGVKYGINHPIDSSKYTGVALWNAITGDRTSNQKIIRWTRSNHTSGSRSRRR